MADALFREAKKLIAEGKHPEACRKLEESQRLDPGDGTLLNLAVCHENEGKLATAFVEFKESLEAAQRANRWDRIKLAERRLDALASQLPRLTIDVSNGAAVEGFELRRDGVVISKAVWGTAVPVDPGQHGLEATAPGRSTWKSSFSIGVGEEKTVVVPVLQAKPMPPQSKSKPGSESVPEPEPEPESTSSRRNTAYIVGGAGIVALGVGTFYGLRATSKRKESDDYCGGGSCTQQGLDLNDEARSAARVSNVAIGLGLIGVGFGTYLLLTEPSGPKKVKTEQVRMWRFTPVAGSQQAAFIVDGRW